jgi:hypothetical protein
MSRIPIRITLTVLFAVPVLLLCTSGKIKEEKVKGVNEAALNCVFCDKRIDTSDFKSIGAAANQLAQDKDFDLKPTADKLRDDIFNRYAQGFPFKVADENAVIHSPAYTKLASNKFDLNKVFFAAPDGYVILPYTN